MIKSVKKQKTDIQTRIYLFHGVKTFADAQLRKIANYVSSKAQRIPEQKLARILIGACVVIAVALGIRLFYAFNHRSGMKFQSIHISLQKPSYSSSVDENVLWRIKKFHHYLDSLKKNDLSLYDSIMVSRPHLIDSIITIEEFTNQ